MPQTERQTITKLYRLTALWVVLVAMVGLSGAPAIAQNGVSPAELRRENDRLQEQITELKAALLESQRKVEALESQIDDLTEAPGAIPPDAIPQRPAPIDPTDRPIPSEASSCPDSLYGSLVDNYNDAFPGIELPAFAEVQQWIRRVSRDRRRVTWLIRAHETTIVQGKTSSVLVNLVDPTTREAICNNFVIPLSYAHAMRIDDATEVTLWEFTGTFAAKPIADRSRPEFDSEASRRLIGPFAVFGWTYDVQRIVPVERTNDPDAQKPKQR